MQAAEILLRHPFRCFQESTDLVPDHMLETVAADKAFPAGDEHVRRSRSALHPG
jgi:hypothetical protein